MKSPLISALALVTIRSKAGPRADRVSVGLAYLSGGFGLSISAFKIRKWRASSPIL